MWYKNNVALLFSCFQIADVLKSIECHQILRYQVGPSEPAEI
jgi:hypothetical protein